MSGIKSARRSYTERVSALARANQADNLSDLVRREDREGIITYFLPDVIKIAQTYATSTPRRLEVEDLISAGNLALVQSVNVPGKIYLSTLMTNTLSAIETGVKSHILRETAHRSIIETNEEEIKRASVDNMPQLMDDSDRRRLQPEAIEIMKREIINYTSNPLQSRWDVFAHTYGITDDGEPIDNHKDIAKAAGIDHFPSYRTIVGNRLSQAHQALSRILSSSSISPIQLPWYVNRNTPEAKRMADAPKLREYFEILKNSPQEEIPGYVRVNVRSDLKATLDQVREDFMKRYDLAPEEFRRKMKLSARDFANYLASLYPHLGEKFALRLVHFTDQEKKQLIFKEMSAHERPSDIASIRRTIRRLRAQEVPKERSLLEKLEEMYIPFFAADSQKCLQVLEREARDPSNPEAVRRIYSGMHWNFKRIKSLSYPQIKSDLDDFQKIDVEIISTRPSNIIASEMGTGKSLEVITYALDKKLPRKLIVSTHSGTHVTWPDEIRKHVRGDQSVEILTGEKARDKSALEKALNADWTLVTYNTASLYIPELRKAHFDLIVLDECHKINNPDTNQSMALTSLDAPYKMGVSGFLFKNERRELFQLLNWLYPVDFPDREDFERTHCEDREGLALLQYELRNRMVLRFKDQVLKLPAVEPINHVLEFTPSQRKEYEGLEEDFVSWYRAKIGASGQINVSQAVLTKLHHLRKKAVEPKLGLVQELVDQIVHTEGGKPVVYTTYVSIADELRKRLRKFGLCYLDGRSLPNERVEAVRGFHEDPSKKVFIITAAGGESINLIPGTDFIYANKPLTYADEKQALDRLHRRGQRRKIRAHHLTTHGTIEDRIQALNERKRKEYQGVVHNSAGYTRWFEESENDNVREIVKSLLGK